MSIKKMKMGLIGSNIDYSLSPRLFSHPVISELLPHSFDLINLNNTQEWDVFWKTEARHYQHLCITTPWKRKAQDLELSSISPEGATTKVINWINIKDNKLHAYNTDYFSFQKWWYNLPKNLPQEIYYLGHGASSHTFFGMLNDYLKQHPSYKPHLTIVTRHPKDQTQPDCFQYMKVKFIQYPEFTNKKINYQTLVINGSLYGQKEEFPLELIKMFEQALVWDLNYAKPYSYLSYYQKNGFEFLVQQALFFLTLNNYISKEFYLEHVESLVEFIKKDNNNDS